MIKSLYPNDSWISMTGNTPSFIYIDSNKVQQGIAGQVRYNGMDFQVNDGNTWQSIPSGYASISMSQQAQDSFQWVIKKMADEQEAQELAKDHPAVQIALNNLEKAKQQLNATILLSKEHNESTS